MNKLLTILVLIISMTAQAQPDQLPITFLPGKDSSKPVIFYISGDGGWNKFSSALAAEFNKQGYTVAGLDAKKYFWEKKTPIEAAKAISSYLTTLLTKPNTRVIFSGYSFGADVTPFIVNTLPESMRLRIRSVVLISPSTSTDFEIHWSDMLGFNKKRGEDVATSINQLNVPKVLAVFGGDDKENFPVNTIHLKNFSSKTLTGNHHYDGNSAELAQTIISGS